MTLTADNIRQLQKLNSNDNADDIVIINNRFLCRFEEKYNGNGCYYYATETYQDKVVPSRMVFDIDLIAYDTQTGKEFYATWAIADDTDLETSEYSSALYGYGDNAIYTMFSVVDYSILHWTLSQRLVGESQSDA